SPRAASRPRRLTPTTPTRSTKPAPASGSRSRTEPRSTRLRTRGSIARGRVVSLCYRPTVAAMSEPTDPPATGPHTHDQTPEDVERMLAPSGDTSATSEKSLFSPGDRLPNLEMWVLTRRLGGGGFGEVWHARHERKGEAAVKFCTDPTARHK